jgi:Na+/proline symporter/signal transduction histidine kinase/CheY-like chemotaxis protein
MFSVEFIAFIGFSYILVLFLIAYLGDSEKEKGGPNHNSNLVYALSLAVYCSSWTFYGAVGTASVDGLDYLAIYLGPCLVFLFGYRMMRRIILICKQNSITSISDFISSRFGKDRKIGVLVTTIAVVGSLPYIALQLKAVSSSYLVLVSQSVAPHSSVTSLITDNIALITGAALALFTILFGTRHLDATEHHKGLILAVAFESIVKLVAILAVGYYAIYLLMGLGSENSFVQIVEDSSSQGFFSNNTSTWASFLTKTLLATSAIFLLPRQFQVTVVEARDHHQFKTAMWVMPIYLVLTSFIVLPIALTGSILLPESPADLYVLSLPLAAGNDTLALLAFIGGLSAATGMVIVAAISLSTMVCNDLVMPYLINHRRLDILNSDNLNEIILLIRRIAIVGLIAGAYGYYLLIDNNAKLANIGLVSFAAIVQLLPAVLCALYWRSANRKGVFWGLIGGFAVWAYTLMTPTILNGETIQSVTGVAAWYHPHALFGMRLDNSLSHGVFWSLLVNVTLLLWFSLRDKQSVLEKIQASRFFYVNDTPSNLSSTGPEQAFIVHPDALRILTERIIGRRNTQAVFSQFEQRQGVSLSDVSQVDRQLLSLVQNAIAGVIGATSAQKIISDALLGSDQYIEEVTTFVDETSSVLQFNRNLLQTTLQNITHGISVIDRDLNLVIWNDQYLSLFGYPENLIYVGKPLRELLRFNAERGDFGDKDHNLEISKRIKYLQKETSYSTIRKRANGTTIKSIGEPMPGGGFVTTYEDISDSVRASEMLRQANEELESRVKERTEKLEILTKELERSTRNKTHLLAAASHDLLQPINAARLFTHSISEQADDPNSVRHLAQKIDKSLVTANELLRALLDVSKLDSGGITPELSDFSLDAFIGGLVEEMQPSANDKKVLLHYSAANVMVFSDKKLLLSVLQNLVANGLRYSDEGGSVLVQAKLLEDSRRVEISVEDRGVGIDAEHLDQIFNEFYQIKKEGREETRGLGLGLGLSIVKRISRLLDLKVKVVSKPGVGSRFSIYIPYTDKSVVLPEPRRNINTNFAARLVGAQILCLDNDESALEAMRTLLEGWGAIVTSVATYSRAVDALSEVDFDLILADYRLDFAKTGLDFLLIADIKGALITAEQDKTLKTQAKDLGYQYLAKPIEPAALKAVLLYLLDTEA